MKTQRKNLLLVLLPIIIMGCTGNNPNPSNTLTANFNTFNTSTDTYTPITAVTLKLGQTESFVLIANNLTLSGQSPITYNITLIDEGTSIKQPNVTINNPNCVFNLNKNVCNFNVTATVIGNSIIQPQEGSTIIQNNKLTINVTN